VGSGVSPLRGDVVPWARGLPDDHVQPVEERIAEVAKPLHGLITNLRR